MQASSACLSCLQVVELGRHEMDTWYWSPYPEPYASQKQLYISEVTLKYFRTKQGLVQHMARTQARAELRGTAS